MTVTNYTAATDELFRTFTATWNTGASAIASYVPEVRYPGDGKTTSPDASKIWARISQQGVMQEKTTISDEIGFSLHSATNLVAVQLFIPKNVVGSLRIARLLATLAKAAFLQRTDDGCVWFRRQRIVELPDEATYYRINVLAEYLYEERL